MFKIPNLKGKQYLNNRYCSKMPYRSRKKGSDEAVSKEEGEVTRKQG